MLLGTFDLSPGDGPLVETSDDANDKVLIDAVEANQAQRAISISLHRQKIFAILGVLLKELLTVGNPRVIPGNPNPFQGPSIRLEPRAGAVFAARSTTP